MSIISSSANSVGTDANYWNALQKRNARQQDRIIQGMASGQITSTEKESLDKSRAVIDEQTAKAVSDGSISKDEFTGLMQAYNDRSNAIRTDRHNDLAADGVTPDTGAEVADAAASQADASPAATVEGIIQKRSDALAATLAQGVKAGTISTDAAQEITTQQDAINKLVEQSKTDGSISSAEFTQIMHAQNQERHMLHRMRNNPYAQAAMQTATQAATQGTTQDATPSFTNGIATALTGVKEAATAVAVKAINLKV